MALEAASQNNVTSNNEFYCKNYHYFILGLMGLIVLLLICVGVVMYQTFNRPIPIFSAIQPDNQEMQLMPLNEPNLLPETILRFASKAATVAYSFDYANYEQELLAARPYFTAPGWGDYQASVRSLIASLIQKQLIVTGVVSGAPVISNEGPLPGKGYVWRVQVPFLVTYQSANTTSRRNFYVVLTIIRVPTSTNPQGIGIDQFVMV